MKVNIEINYKNFKIKVISYSFSFLSLMHCWIIDRYFKNLRIYPYHNCSKFHLYDKKLTNLIFFCSFAIHDTYNFYLFTGQCNYDTFRLVMINNSWPFTSWSLWVFLLCLFWKWSLVNINKVITIWNEFKNP